MNKIERLDELKKQIEALRAEIKAEEKPVNTFEARKSPFADELQVRCNSSHGECATFLNTDKTHDLTLFNDDDGTWEQVEHGKYLRFTYTPK